MFLGYALLQVPEFIAAIITWIKNAYYRRTNRQAQAYPEPISAVVRSESGISNPKQTKQSANKTLDECSVWFEEKWNAFHQELEELKCRKLNALCQEFEELKRSSDARDQ